MGTVNGLDSFALSAPSLFDPVRFERPDLGMVVEPTFRLSPTDKVFVIGSCFATRLRELLCSLGLDASDAGLDLKYNAFSMGQELVWSLAGGFDERYICRTTDGRYLNPHRHPARPVATLEAAYQPHVEAQARARLLIHSADVVVLTLGLVEAWVDSWLNVYTNETPSVHLIPRGSERFRCRRTGHAENLTAILALVRLVRGVNPRVRFIASVSPVPLRATFCGGDVLAANTYSKSTLRSALGEAIDTLRSEDDAVIDYFPSYELVTLAPSREPIWQEQFENGAPDGRHILPSFVNEVIGPVFLRAYLPSMATRAAA